MCRNVCWSKDGFSDEFCFTCTVARSHATPDRSVSLANIWVFFFVWERFFGRLSPPEGLVAPARAFGHRILAGATICGGETVGSGTKEKSPHAVACVHENFEQFNRSKQDGAFESLVKH